MTIQKKNTVQEPGANSGMDPVTASDTENLHVLTFGCRLNALESDGMRHLAQKAARQGGDYAQDGNQTTIIVNSCTVTAEAERQARQAIRRAHKENPEARIIVTGCASEREPAQWRALPGVSSVLANRDKLSGAAWGLSPQNTPSPPPSRHIRALLQVQQGCDHRCTFCVIPFGRGEARSSPVTDILARARTLVEAGHREIVLTGVDIASWRPEHPETNIATIRGPNHNSHGLGRLCRTLLQEFPDLERLRLSSIDPVLLDLRTGDQDLWQLIANEPRFMPHLHLSLQAGSALILKRMKRRHNPAQLREIIGRARQLRPMTGFGADLIAGFPTEDETLFEEGYRLIEELAIPFLHVFPYSERPGTPAAKMPALPRAIRQERAARLRLLGEKNRDTFLETFIGHKSRILFESARTGHSPEFAAMSLEDRQTQAGETGRRGEIADVQVISRKEGHLLVRLI